jgi:tetratricopeptide (TPR) repeat protein
MDRALAVLADDEPDEDLAALAESVGRLHYFAGNLDAAAERCDLALAIAESLWLPRVLAEALNTSGLVADGRWRKEEALALSKHALELALEHDVVEAAIRAANNLAILYGDRDRYPDSVAVHERAIALVRKAGDRAREWQVLDSLSEALALMGEWDAALDAIAPVPDEELGAAGGGVLVGAVFIDTHRGRVEEARRLVSALGRMESSADGQERAYFAAGNATVLWAEGKHREALRAGNDAVASIATISPGNLSAKIGFSAGMEAALALGDHQAARELLQTVERLKPGEMPPFHRAQTARFRARLGAAEGAATRVDDDFKGAAAVFREYGIPFWLAVTLLDHGEWLVAIGRADEARRLLDEARARPTGRYDRRASDLGEHHGM